jgi:hypothetical protein
MVTADERYLSDSVFRTLVDTLYNIIAKGNTTPTELRQALFMAQYMFEFRHPRSLYFTKEEENVS